MYKKNIDKTDIENTLNKYKNQINKVNIIRKLQNKKLLFHFNEEEYLCIYNDSLFEFLFRNFNGYNQFTCFYNNINIVMFNRYKKLFKNKFIKLYDYLISNNYINLMHMNINTLEEVDYIINLCIKYQLKYLGE